MKSRTTRIPTHTLIQWLDDASERYAMRENDPANRAIDSIKLDLVRYFHGKDFETGYMFEHVDSAIDALRQKGQQTSVVAAVQGGKR